MKDRNFTLQAKNSSLESKILSLESMKSLLSSQLEEARNKLSVSDRTLSEVEKNYKLLKADHDALTNISIEHCDELILTLHRNEEKILQRRVSDEPY